MPNLKPVLWSAIIEEWAELTVTIQVIEPNSGAAVEFERGTPWQHAGISLDDGRLAQDIEMVDRDGELYADIQFGMPELEGTERLRIQGPSSGRRGTQGEWLMPIDMRLDGEP